ncbi:MAG TPA: hypothetical protein VFC19_06525 [Candidatus Limnocylindrales bacterium]|nr:hypothetical protein [Candidatus Limnocylindrales bacterium]
MEDALPDGDHGNFKLSLSTRWWRWTLRRRMDKTNFSVVYTRGGGAPAYARPIRPWAALQHCVAICCLCGRCRLEETSVYA